MRFGTAGIRSTLAPDEQRTLHIPAGDGTTSLEVEMADEAQPELPPTHVLVGTSDGEKLVGERYITLGELALALVEGRKPSVQTDLDMIDEFFVQFEADADDGFRSAMVTALSSRPRCLSLLASLHQRSVVRRGTAAQ